MNSSSGDASKVSGRQIAVAYRVDTTDVQAWMQSTLGEQLWRAIAP